MESSHIFNKEDYDNFMSSYDKVSKLPPEKQRLIYFTEKSIMNFELTRSITIYACKESEDKITVYSQTRVLCCKVKVFLKTEHFYGFTFYKQSKKIKMFNSDLSGVKPLINKYLAHINYNWFITMPFNLRDFITKTVLEDIMSGKITSQESYLKKVIKVSFKGKLYLRNIKAFFPDDNWNGKRITVFNTTRSTLLRYIINYVDNPNAFIDRMFIGNDINNEYLSIFVDTCHQCKIYDKKICWKWSLKRLNEFHLELVRRENFEIASFIEDNNIDYEGTLAFPDGTKCDIISSARKAYCEGNEQSNCVYTNYWNKISNRSYFVIKCLYPERSTVGISLRMDNDNKYHPYIDQIYGKRNTKVRDDTKKIFYDWIRKENVQDFFIKNYRNNYNNKKINVF